MQRAWVLVLVLASCASSPPPAPASSASAAAPMPGEVSCDQAVGHMMDVLTAGKADAPPADVKKFHDLFVSHCQADAWAPQVRACFGGIKTVDDGDKCAAQMTDPQRQALDDATAPPGASGGAAPPPPAAEPAETAPPASSAPSAPASTTRSPTTKPKKSGDPCDGGN